jgi:hypothetical protein
MKFRALLVALCLLALGSSTIWFIGKRKASGLSREQMRIIATKFINAPKELLEDINEGHLKELDLMLMLPEGNPQRKAYFAQRNEELGKAKIDALVRSYAPLFAKLHLTEEETRAITDFLVTESLVAGPILTPLSKTNVPATANIPDGPLHGTYTFTGNSGDVDAAFREIEAAEAGTETQIEKLLGAERFEIYRNFQDIRWLRQVAECVQSYLNRESKPKLTDDQISKLAQLMFKKDAPASDRFRLNHLTDSVIEASRAFLSPDQVNALTQEQRDNAIVDHALVDALEALRAGGQPQRGPFVVP